MIMKTTKLLLTMLLTLISFGAWAQETTIDGIRYGINEDGQSAGVAGIEEGVTTANILEQVNIDGSDYPVTHLWCGHLYNSTLKHIYIPKTIVYVDENFCNNDIVETLVVDPENPLYDSRDNCNAIIWKNGELANYACYVLPCSTLPASVKGLQYLYGTFSTFTVPSGVEQLDIRCFYHDCSIGTLYIPASCTTIASAAGWGNISNVVVDPNHPNYYSQDNCIIEKATNKLIGTGTNHPILPRGITLLGEMSLESGGFSNLELDMEFPYKLGYDLSYNYRPVNLIVPEGTIPRYLYHGWGSHFSTITDGTHIYYGEGKGFDWYRPQINLLNFTADKAGEDLTLSVVISGDNVTAFQFDIYLPDGMEVTFDDDGYEDILLSTARTTERKHTLTSQQMADGAWRVVCYSDQNKTFEGYEGEVCTIHVTTNANMANNGHPIVIKNMVTTTIDGEGNKDQIQADQLTSYVNFFTPEFHEMGDANYDGQVNVTDIATVVSYIMGNQPTKFVFGLADVYTDVQINVTDITGIVDVIMNGSAPQQAPRRRAPRRTEGEQPADATTAQLEVIPFAIAPGEEKEVEVLLNNPDDAFTGMQFDLVLPEGISLVSDEVGYLVDLGSRTTTRKHTIEASLQADGTIRVMAYSNRNSNFNGTEGDVAILTLKADDQLTAGVYDVQLKNIVLSQANGGDIDQKVPADYEASILSGTLAENPVIKGDITAEAAAAISAAVSEAVTSIDLTQAVAVADDAAFTTANPNTLVFAPAATTNTTKNVVAGDVCANLQLSDAAVFATPKAFTATTATIARSLTAGTYATLVLPFALTAEQLSSFTNAYTYSETSTDPDAVTVYFTTTNAVTANEPFLALPTATKTSLVFEGVSVEKGNPVVKGTSLDLIGNYDGAITLGEGSFFVAQNQFYRSTGKSHLNSFRAYIAMQEAGVKALNLCIDGNETAITEAKAEVQVPADIYDLLGRKVVKAHKGVYIQNGHKFVR